MKGKKGEKKNKCKDGARGPWFESWREPLPPFLTSPFLRRRRAVQLGSIAKKKKKKKSNLSRKEVDTLPWMMSHFEINTNC